MRSSGIFQSPPAVPLVGKASEKPVLIEKMLVKETKLGFVAWITILWCVLGSVSAKDDSHAIAKHFIRRRSAIQSVSSISGNGLDDELMKGHRWKNNRSEFFLGTQRDPEERVDIVLTSPEGVLTDEVRIAEAGRIADGDSGDPTHGTENRGIRGSKLLEALQARHYDFDEPKKGNKNERGSEERVTDGSSESTPYKRNGRQRREAKVNKKGTDESVHFPGPTTLTRLSTRKKVPNSSAAAGVGGNKSGGAGGGLGIDDIETHFLSDTPSKCPSGQLMLKGRCRAIRP